MAHILVKTYSLLSFKLPEIDLKTDLCTKFSTLSTNFHKQSTSFKKQRNCNKLNETVEIISFDYVNTFLTIFCE